MQNSFMGSLMIRHTRIDGVTGVQTWHFRSVGSKTGYKMNGINHIPELFIDNTDRNRTSPFAFTGNRFEFRAVGSSDNCADAMLTLNTAVAEQLTRFKEAVDRHIESGMKKEKAIYEELKKLIRECKPIHFDGNGYSDEWNAEAARRGLDCETSTPLIFDRYLTRSEEHTSELQSLRLISYAVSFQS